MPSILNFILPKRFLLRTEPPICSMCGKPVALEISKTDEHGKAIHEECYLWKIGRRVGTD